MDVKASIFKSYDIRGTVPEEINEDNIYVISQAVLRFLQNRLKKESITISLGRDMRLSAPTLYPIVKQSLVDGGAQIVDCGLIATPTFYFSVLKLATDAGIVLTASHNPPNYNGLKMVIRDGAKLNKIGSGTGMEEIKGLATSNPQKLTVAGGTETSYETIITEEVDNAIKLVSPGEIKPLTIVADTANAMAATYLEELFKRLPCKLIKMNFELDGSFPAHHPDPLVSENVKDLQERVLKEKADLGLAPDGDGDRMFFIDEKGAVIPGSLITALIARELLKTHPGETFLYDIRYTMTPKQIIEESGGKSGVTKVGHAFITGKIHETGALFGGESSGHYFFRETGGAESQLPIVLFVLKVLTESGKPLSEVIAELRRSYESGEFNFKTNKAKEILDDLQTHFQDGQISLLDGVSIEYEDWRCNVRTSNTEPLLRLNLEAKTEELMEQKLEETRKIILSRGAELHSH